MSRHHVIQCTAKNPWDGKKMPDERVQHHDVEEVGDQIDGYPGGDIQRMRCKKCGTEWTMELPQ